MRILQIVTGLQKASGVTTFVENVVSELRALGNEVDVVTKGAATSRGEGERRSVSDLTAYDVVHLHGLWDPWLHRWARAARRAGVKVVWSPHGMLTPWAMNYKWLKKKAAWLLYQKRDLQRADAIHVTVPNEETDVRRLGLRNLVFVVPLGVRMPGAAAAIRGGGS